MSDLATASSTDPRGQTEKPLYWQLAGKRQLAVEAIQQLSQVIDVLQGPLPYNQKREIIEDIVLAKATQFGVGANAAKDFAVIVTDDIAGLGGLETLIRDESIYNITIKWFEGQPAQVGLQRIGTETKERFTLPLAASLSAFREGIIGNKAIRFSGQPVNWTYASPHVTLYLPTHKIRIAANMLHDNKSIIASVRMNRTGQPDLDEIFKMGMVTSPGMYKFLKVMLASRANFLVVGSTGSGKTTLLRALLHSVDYHDYLYVVEDSPELDLEQRSDKHDMILPLVPTKERNMSALIRDSQRYMADRIIIGEALDDSIIDWFTVANVTGGGGMTLHAEEPGSIFRRVKNMIGEKLSEREVYERMAESVDVIIFVRRRFDRTPERQIENIMVLTHQLTPDGKPLFADLWAYKPETRQVAWSNIIIDPIQDKFARTGLRLTPSEEDAHFIRVFNRDLDPLLKGVADDSVGKDDTSSKQINSPGHQREAPGNSELSEEEIMAKLFGGPVKGLFNG